MKLTKILAQAYHMPPAGIKNIAEMPTYKLLEHASLIKFSGPDYHFLPIGWKAITNIENVMRNVSTKYELQEVYEYPLQEKRLWEQSGRFNEFEKDLVHARRGAEQLVLAATSEESISKLIKDQILSYKQLPLIIYEMGDRFRNTTSTHSIIRSHSFRMYDAYSLDTDEMSEESRTVMEKVFKDIFEVLDIDVTRIAKNQDYIDFIIDTPEGEEKLFECDSGHATFFLPQNKVCTECNKPYNPTRGLSIAVFIQLGTKYAQQFEVIYLNDKHQKRYPNMWCYASGSPRLLHAVVDQHRDELGITWPKSVSPIEFGLINTDFREQQQQKYVMNIYEELLNKQQSVIVDDRTDGKIKRARDFFDLIGVSKKIVISHDEVRTNTVSLEDRVTKDVINVDLKDFINSLNYGNHSK